MDERDCKCSDEGCRHGCGSSPLGKGLAVMFILIGLAIFVSAVLGVLLNRFPIGMISLGLSVLWHLIGLVVAVVVIIWIFKLIFRRHCYCGCGCCCGGSCSCGCNDADDKKASKRKRNQ